MDLNGGSKAGVLLVGPRSPPPGGVATHIADLERALEARGISSVIVDPRHDGPDGRLRLARALSWARLCGDLVHVHANGHNRGSWKLAALCSLGGPAVITIHSGLAPAYVRAHAVS